MIIDNIKYIILHSDIAKSSIRALEPATRSIAEFGQLEVFEVSIKPSFFKVGTGNLSAELNKIRVFDATSPTTVIKYHYISTLKTSPKVPIAEHAIPESPIGFIEVQNGSVREFEIYNDYTAKIAPLKQ